MAEVHEKTQLATGDIEMIQELRGMLVDKCRDSLEFDNNIAVADEIRRKCLNKSVTTTLQRLWRLREERNSLPIEFYLQTLMIYWLEKATPFVVIHSKAGTNDSVAFVLKNYLLLFR